MTKNILREELNKMRLLKDDADARVERDLRVLNDTCLEMPPHPGVNLISPDLHEHEPPQDQQQEGLSQVKILPENSLL